MSFDYFYFLNIFFVDLFGYGNQTDNVTSQQQYHGIYENENSVIFPLTVESPYFAGEVGDLSHIFYLKGNSHYDLYSISQIWSTVCVSYF